MSKPTKQIGGLAAALAAAVLFTPIAGADELKGGPYVFDHRGSSPQFRAPVYPADYGYRKSAYGYRYDRREFRRLRRQLADACRRAIVRQADFIGFREVDFDSRGRLDQIGPRRFLVHFAEVEFEGRRREFERGVTCEIGRGRVLSVSGVPQPGRHHFKRYRSGRY